MRPRLVTAEIRVRREVWPALNDGRTNALRRDEVDHLAHIVLKLTDE